MKLPLSLRVSERLKTPIGAARKAGYRRPVSRPAAIRNAVYFLLCRSNPTYGVHTGPASVKNVALSENQLLTPTEGAP